MNKNKLFITASLSVILLIGLSACSNSSNESSSSNNQTEPDNIEENTDNSSPSKDSSKDIVESTPSAQNDTEAAHSDSQPEDNLDERRQESLAAIQKELDALPDKIEGNKTAFLERLDNIQKELDTLPDKEGSDAGATNAMKNYYGISYEKYDEALNAIYATLKKDLSPETMKDLNSKQLKWIEQKEAKAEEERLKYNGGTFENVALYISLYESTKERCYVLVNEYMTD